MLLLGARRREGGRSRLASPETGLRQRRLFLRRACSTPCGVARSTQRTSMARDFHRFMSLRMALSFTVALTVVPSQTRAQGTGANDVATLEPVSVTATRGLQPATDLLADVTVI